MQPVGLTNTRKDLNRLCMPKNLPDHLVTRSTNQHFHLPHIHLALPFGNRYEHSFITEDGVVFKSENRASVVNSHHLKLNFTQAQQAATTGGLLLNHSGSINYPSCLPFMVHQ